MGSSSKHEFIAEVTPRLQPCQIVCLEHETSCLYAEVIQIIESRQLCWARPLILICRPAEPFTCGNASPQRLDSYDLRQDSDLLLPLTLFRVALDTEVFSWITSLYADDRDTTELDKPRERGDQPFRQFIQNVWQAHPNAFQNQSGLSKT